MAIKNKAASAGNAQAIAVWTDTWVARTATLVVRERVLPLDDAASARAARPGQAVLPSAGR